jgi:hypothetical protein
MGTAYFSGGRQFSYAGGAPVVVVADSKGSGVVYVAEEANRQDRLMLSQLVGDECRTGAILRSTIPVLATIDLASRFVTPYRVK